MFGLCRKFHSYKVLLTSFNHFQFYNHDINITFEAMKECNLELFLVQIG